MPYIGKSPDLNASVDTNELADDAVTLGKIGEDVKTAISGSVVSGVSGSVTSTGSFGRVETDNLTVGGSQGSDGEVLTSTGTGVAWEAAAGGADDMSWNDGTATRISGSSASIASFGTVMSDAAVKSGGIYKNPQTITRNETIGASDNAMSAGYLIIDSGVTVVVEEGARWVII